MWMVQYLALGMIRILQAQFLLMEEIMLFAGKCTNLVWFKGDCEGGSVGVESRTADRQWKAFELNNNRQCFYNLFVQHSPMKHLLCCWSLGPIPDLLNQKLQGHGLWEQTWSLSYLFAQMPTAPIYVCRIFLQSPLFSAWRFSLPHVGQLGRAVKLMASGVGLSQWQEGAGRWHTSILHLGPSDTIADTCSELCPQTP